MSNQMNNVMLIENLINVNVSSRGNRLAAAVEWQLNPYCDGTYTKEHVSENWAHIWELYLAYHEVNPDYIFNES